MNDWLKHWGRRIHRYSRPKANIRPITTEVFRANTQTCIACRARDGRGCHHGVRADGIRAGQFQLERRYAAATAALRSGAGAAPGLRMGAGLLELERRQLRLDRRRVASRTSRLCLLQPAMGAARRPLGLSPRLLGTRSALARTPRQWSPSWVGPPRPRPRPRVRSRTWWPSPLIDRCFDTKPGASAPGFFVPECSCRLVLSAAKPNNGADDAGAFL